MANEAAALCKDLIKRGYNVLPPTGRGRVYSEIRDPRHNNILIGRLPANPKPGSWRGNLLAAIARYERTGVPTRSACLRPGADAAARV